jgi:hypothetical protein
MRSWTSGGSASTRDICNRRRSRAGRSAKRCRPTPKSAGADHRSSMSPCRRRRRQSAPKRTPARGTQEWRIRETSSSFTAPGMAGGAGPALRRCRTARGSPWWHNRCSDRSETSRPDLIVKQMVDDVVAWFRQAGFQDCMLTNPGGVTAIIVQQPEPWEPVRANCRRGPPSPRSRTSDACSPGRIRTWASPRSSRGLR